MPPNFVGGTGPSDAKIAFVGEAPGADEDQAGIPFVGASGRMLDELMSAAGIQRKQCYLTNVSKYRPPGNIFKDLPKVGIDIDKQKEVLYNELAQLKPNVVVAVGKIAMETLCAEKGVNKYRGSILRSKTGGYKVIPIIHTRNIIVPKGIGGVDYFYKFITKLDLDKAKRESEYPDFRLPKRLLQIIKNPYQLYKFLEENKSSKIVCLDLETQACVPVCLGLAFNAYHGASIPLFPVRTAKSSVELSKSDQVEIWQILAKFLSDPTLTFLGQNFKFDHEKLIRPLRLIGWGEGRLHADLSLMMEVCYPELPKNLGFLASVFSSEPYWKDEGKEFNYKTDRVEQLFYYNGKDVTVPWEIYGELLQELKDIDRVEFYFEYQNKLHDLYMQIEDEGLLRDEKKREKLSKIFHRYDRMIDRKLNELLEWTCNGQRKGFNSGSPKQVSEAVYGILGLPPRENTNEHSLVSLIAYLGTIAAKQANEKGKLNIARCSKGLDLILKSRKVKKNISTYLDIATDADGYMRTSYRISSKKGEDI